MAKLKLELPTDLIKQFGTLEKNSEQLMGKVTKAGAEVVYKNIKKNMSSSFSSSTKSKMEAGLKITRTYKSPKKGTIGNFVGFYGYIPFSDPNRKFFSRKGAGGTVYKTDKGVPRDFLAQVAEYGTSQIPKKPFIKKSQKKAEIEKAMQEVLDKETEKVIK
jgi:HK97 gp10 family phage protein